MFLPLLIIIGLASPISAHGFKYDVFLCAHDEASATAHDEILLPLENHCDPPYKVCWHMRDFIVGVPITEQIVDAVQKSRKVIFIFTDHFMESRFCCLELEHTLHRLRMTRTRCLIPIALRNGVVPEQLKSRITYWPTIRLDEDEFLHRITELIGE